MKRTPSILFVPWEDNGVGLYRIIIPMISLAGKNGIKVETMAPFTGESFRNMEIDLEFMAKSIKQHRHNILYTTKPLGPHQLAFCRAVQHMGYKWVLDMDDNILDVNKDNPGYAAFAKEGSGDMRFFEEVAMRECDLLVVSTENLAKVYESYNKNIFINPNMIDFKFWKHTNAWGKSDKVIIGWAGAGGHRFDMSLIEGVVKEIKEKYGDKVEFVSFGGEQPKFFDRHENWVPLREYPAKLASLGFDIGLAPLRDNVYNRGKSNLRWLEYSSLKIPTIASDVLPYRDTNALLCSTHEEWVAALSLLIDYPIERRSRGEAAYRLVRRKYSSRFVNSKLIARLEKLVEVHFSHYGRKWDEQRKKQRSEATQGNRIGMTKAEFEAQKNGKSIATATAGGSDSGPDIVQGSTADSSTS